MSATTFRSRRATALVGAALLAVALVGCSSDDTEPKEQDSVASSEASDDDTEESPDSDETAVDDGESDSDSDEADFDPVSEDALAEAVAGAMDEETGTQFPVECDGGIDSVVGATQRCWRVITGMAAEGVPDDSRLGIDVTVDYLNTDGPHLDMQADDAITPPED